MASIEPGRGLPGEAGHVPHAGGAHRAGHQPVSGIPSHQRAADEMKRELAQAATRTGGSAATHSWLAPERMGSLTDGAARHGGLWRAVRRMPSQLNCLRAPSSWRR
jgi:hypothetical protein